MDKETILKTLMNIIDIKHHQEWKTLDTENLIDVMKNRMYSLIVSQNEKAKAEIENYFNKYLKIFNKISQNIQIDCYELNDIRDPFIKIKMQYFVNNK